jgi:predicted HNH restriction endonuclease
MPARLQSDQTINPILQRIKEIDATNEKNGVISKEVTSKVYERDEELNRLLKVHRGAACQICGYYFLTAKDERYVECHHLEYLANDGFDCSKNMLIVCANHHRQLHYGKTKILNHTSEQVIIEIDDVVHVCQL